LVHLGEGEIEKSHTLSYHVPLKSSMNNMPQFLILVGSASQLIITKDLLSLTHTDYIGSFCNVFVKFQDMSETYIPLNVIIKEGPVLVPNEY
jgi:hypothetical protein